MTYQAQQAVPSGQRRNKPPRRSAWLKTSIVSASILATLAGTQGIAWLESRNALADLAGADTPLIAEAVFASAAEPATLPAPAAEQPIGTNASEISLLALLPTPTPGATIAVAASAPVNPTDTPAPTPTSMPTIAPTIAPTATPAAAIVSAPVQSQPGSAIRPLTRSRSSR